MRFAALLFLLAALVSASAAPAESRDSVDVLLTEFDMFGLWAPNCKAEAAPTNPYVRVTSRGPGVVIEEHNLGPSYALNQYSVTDAKRISKTDLSVKVILHPGKDDEERLLLTFRLRDKTRRTLFNQVEGGAVRVKDGMTVGYGTRTPLLSKCE